MTDKEAYAIVVDSVITVREVCALYGRSQTSVMMDIYKGNIAARQADYGKIWLVSRLSCERYYNKKESA